MRTDNAELLNKLDEIKRKYSDFCSKNTQQKIHELEYQLQEDFFTVVILGEFKRGKSTFVNALLKKDILPVDVLPETATINALIWDEKGRTEAVHQDGTVESGTTEKSFLNRFTAKKEENLADIQYLKIGIEADILQNNIILVDTPGVSDLNEQRIQLTYDFIPRADMVVFLLDANAPLKKSEKEFVETYLQQIGLDKIIFIANKFDEVDEEDEETIIEDIRKRLSYAFREIDKENITKKITLLPLSAEMALAGVLEKDEQKTATSGIRQVEEKLCESIAMGTSVEEKRARYHRRYRIILNAIEREIDNRICLSQRSTEDLKFGIAQLQKILQEKSGKIETLNRYIENEQGNILDMTKKSIVYFYNELKNDITKEIAMCSGSNFKDFVEQRIPDMVHRGMKRWVSLHFPSIEVLFEKLNQQIIQSLAAYFKETINMPASHVLLNPSMVEKHFLMQIEAQDVSSATRNAGIITGTTAAIAIVAGATMIGPLLSMVAFPFLQKELLGKNLKEAKVQVQPQVEEAIGKCFFSLTEEVEKVIQDKVNEVKANTETIYQNLVEHVKLQINTELCNREQEKKDALQQIEEYQQKLKEIQAKKAILKI